MEIEDPGNLFYLMYNHVVRVQSIKFAAAQIDAVCKNVKVIHAYISV